jgi:cell division protein FtsW (lipid II flippase)
MALVVFGVIMVSASSYYSAINDYGRSLQLPNKDVVWAALGLCAMHLVRMFDYRSLCKSRSDFLIASIVLLGRC